MLDKQSHDKWKIEQCEKNKSIMHKKKFQVQASFEETLFSTKGEIVQAISLSFR